MTTTTTTRSARCYCGGVVVSVRETPGRVFSCSLCHCNICRKLSGAPMMASVVVPTAAVTVEGEVRELATSKHVTRRRCANCGAPVCATLGKKQVAVPLALFDRDVPWTPQHHIHYEDRIFDVLDGLPKFIDRYGGPICDDRGAPLPPSEE